MRLQSHDEHAFVARFDPDGRGFVEIPRAEAGALLALPLGGHFSRQFGVLAVLYRDVEALRLQIGRDDYPLDQTMVEWSVHGRVARIEWNTPAGVCVFEYAAAQTLEFDFTAGAEPEHFDFGLFVATIASDAERAALMYGGEATT